MKRTAKRTANWVDQAVGPRGRDERTKTEKKDGRRRASEGKGWGENERMGVDSSWEGGR